MRALGASALAAGTLVAAANARVAGPPEPKTGYPFTPRTLVGGNPLAQLPRPLECPTRRPRYVRLSTLPKRTVKDSPFVAKGKGSTTRVTFVNRKGQKFAIDVSAGSRATAKSFVAAASACLEALPMTQSDPKVVVPVVFTDELVRAAVKLTGLTVAKLAALRDQLDAVGEPDSLRDVLTVQCQCADEVLESADLPTEARLRARFGPAEAGALDVPSLLEQLMDQDAAPYVTNPADDATTPAERSAFLAEHVDTAVVVGIAPVGTPQHPLPKRPIVWGAFRLSAKHTLTAADHGPLAEGAYHYYAARCQKSVFAQIDATAGAAVMKLARAYDWHQYSTSSAAGGPSEKLDPTSQTNRTYDMWVKGLRDGTTYDSFYGWTIGNNNNAC